MPYFQQTHFRFQHSLPWDNGCVGTIAARGYMYHQLLVMSLALAASVSATFLLFAFMSARFSASHYLNVKLHSLETSKYGLLVYQVSWMFGIALAGRVSGLLPNHRLFHARCCNSSCFSWSTNPKQWTTMLTGFLEAFPNRNPSGRPWKIRLLALATPFQKAMILLVSSSVEPVVECSRKRQKTVGDLFGVGSSSLSSSDATFPNAHLLVQAYQRRGRRSSFLWESCPR